MGNWFSGSESGPGAGNAITEHDRAILDLKAQRDRLEVYVKKVRKFWRVEALPTLTQFRSCFLAAARSRQSQRRGRRQAPHQGRKALASAIMPQKAQISRSLNQSFGTNVFEPRSTCASPLLGPQKNYSQFNYCFTASLSQFKGRLTTGTIARDFRFAPFPPRHSRIFKMLLFPLFTL
jgi:hypothetical protein